MRPDGTEVLLKVVLPIGSSPLMVLVRTASKMRKRDVHFTNVARTFCFGVTVVRIRFPLCMPS